MNEKLKSFIRHLGLNEFDFYANNDDFSVIVCLFPYFVAGESGNVSMHARSFDYHLICTEKLNKIREFIEINGGTIAALQVDNGELDDKAAAFKAGLGFFGKNGLLINERLGSYFFIGQIICKPGFLNVQELAPYGDTQKRVKGCKNCGRCGAACPTSAIGAESVDYKKCVSYIGQKRGILSLDEQEFMRRSTFVWGCDVCLQVCAFNKNLKTTALPEFLENRILNLTLNDIENKSEKDFKNAYRNYSFAWRGKKPLIRNLKLKK